MNLLSSLGGGTNAYTSASATPGKLVSSSILDQVAAEDKKFKEDAAKQAFTGYGRYDTGYTTTDSLDFSGDIGSVVGGAVKNVLGDGVSITRPKYEETSSSSSVSDYLKDPAAFKARTVINPTVENTVKEAAANDQQIRKEWSDIIQKYGATGVPDDIAKKYETAFENSRANIVNSERALRKETARAEADKQVASQIEKYLKDRGYGRQIVLQRTKEGSGNPNVNTGTYIRRG
jgi:hypothetical protein